MHGMNKAWPGMVEGVDLIGSTQIQGRCSLAGNLCNASPAADSVPALYRRRARSPWSSAARAGARCRSSRSPPARAAPRSPRTSSSSSSSSRRGRRAQCDAYLRFIPRTEMDIAVVGCGINVTLDAGGTCTAARVVARRGGADRAAGRRTRPRR